MIQTQKMDEQAAAACLPLRKRDSHKGDYGYVALAGGCLEYSGAPRLAALANSAMRAGAGVAVAAAPRSLCPLIGPYVLESTLFPLSETEAGSLRFLEEEWAVLCRRVKTMAFGMGIGRSEEVKKALAYVLENFEGTLIIDADGLWALSELPREAARTSKARILLTPHLGEASRLLGVEIPEIAADPLRWGEDLARRLGCTILLKGASTIVTDGQETWISDRGCPGMATAGSGDVLSGVLAALLAYGEGAIPRLAAAGAYICGMAGELAETETGPTAMVASDTARNIGQAVRQLEILRDSQK